MPIIIHSKDQNLDWSRINLYPDQFVPESEKQSDDWVKHNMDYFANVAYSQFVKNRDTFLKNYDLVKGILHPEDFYIQEEVKSFVDTLTSEIELPSHVKHYSILNPINTLVGELSKRPDGKRVKAFDDDSKNEELSFKTDILQQYIIQDAKNKIIGKLAEQGKQPPAEDELNQLTMEQVEEYMVSYTSLGEMWGNHVIEAMKMEFNLKEISEDCFRDLLISAREFWHVFEDNTKLGFGVENVNPKNVWFLTMPDKKFISDPSGRIGGAYAAGMVHVMELSEIIERFDLSKDEIDHLRNGVRELSLFSPRESNLMDSQTSGWDSIKYDTYSPLIVQQRLILESQIKENRDPLNDFLGLSSNVNTFGNKYVVVQAYWVSKKKVGKVNYIDEQGEQQSTLVDEHYEKVPNQIGEVQWGYINQWYQGYKIGPDVYKVKPYELLNYCPIIGAVFEIKNIDSGKSLVDLLKPYQILYNVCLNQLFSLLEKEIGNVYQGSIRHIPTPKDGDGQDALDAWEEEARRRGVMFLDDSPENTKSPSNFNQFKNVDLTRTQEIQSRYNLAIQLKNEAWEQVGITRQRQGGTAGATETATATQAGLSQSYAQTEPYFVTHEYIVLQVFQAILDAAQYVELQKPGSTLSYVNSEGESKFIQINANDLSMRDLKVFVTSRPEDQKMFEELRQLAQPMLQNGASPYDISVLYNTNSVRQMRKIFKSLKEKQEQMVEQEQQMKQQELQQQQQQFQANLQQQAQQHEADQQFQGYQRELDRLSKERIAIIQATGYGKVTSEDNNNNSVPDVLEASKLALEQQRVEKDHAARKEELLLKNQQETNKIKLAMEKLKVERENMSNDLQIEKLRLKNSQIKKSKTKK